MRKILYILLIQNILFSNNSYSQSLNPELVNFPVSPEVARMMSRGNIPVNLYNGQLQKSVELFNSNIGEYNFPITLNYNYSGFRLEDTPSIVGVGWQLNVGGAVTREVRGLPDEHRNGYYGNSQLREYILGNFFDNNTLSFQNAKKIIDGEYDSEVDKYSVSVNGIHFSFKIGLDGNPCFLSKHDYKLSITRNSANPNRIDSFLLTDTKGNKYIFDQTETNTGIDGNSSIFDDSFPNYISSWQLSDIILNDSRTIHYSYVSDDYYSYNFYASGVFRNGYSNSRLPQAYNQGFTKQLINRKILKKIESEQFTCVFDIETLNDTEIYDNIKIYDHNELLVSNFDFVYSGNRNSLEKIKKNNEFYYEFSYFGGTNYPPFITSGNQYPWSQDDWGFYNGVSNLYGVSVPGTGINANKTPSFTSTQIGALKIIKYPTGGYTEIFYEQNTVKPDPNPADNNPTPNMRLQLKFKTDFNSSASLIKEKYFRKTFLTDVVATLSTTVRSVTQADIEVKIDAIPVSGVFGSPGNLLEQFYYKIPQIRTLTGVAIPTCVPKFYELVNDGYTTPSYTNTRTSSGKFIIPAGEYEFRFKSHDNRKNASAEIILDYYSEEVADSTKIVHNKIVGGIRVSKTIDYPMEGSPLVKNYEYNDDDGYSRGILFSKLTNKISYIEHFSYPYGNGFRTDPFSVNEYTGRSFNQMLRSGIPVYYSGVREYVESEGTFVRSRVLCNCSGDLGTNYDGSPQHYYLGGQLGRTKIKYPKGFVSKGFGSARRVPSNSYPFTPNGDDLSAGVAVSNSVFKETNVNFMHQILTKENSTYQFSNNSNWQDIYQNPNYPKSLKMGYRIKQTGGVVEYTNQILGHYYILDIYKEFDSQSYLSSTNLTEYISGQEVNKASEIEYDTHFQQKKITSNDHSGQLKTKELFYPYDFNDNVSQNMVTKNNISPIVKIIDKTDGEVIETTSFQYQNIMTNLFKPVRFLKSKGQNPLEILMYYGYDNIGNVTTYRKDISGGHTMIIWGYNRSLPIAKIENIQVHLGDPPLPIIALSVFEELSNEDNDNCRLPACKEQLLRDKLDLLRNSYPNALVTTYTYDPLIGMTSMAMPNGEKTFYEYDSFGRLKFVRDNEGNILSQNQYQYKL